MATKVLMGFYFYPRGGSAHACRAIARQLGRNGLDVTLVAGSRSDTGGRGDAREFFAGIDVRPADFTPALRTPDPTGYEGPVGTAPIHGSYEDRPDAEDPVLTSLKDGALERQVSAWAAALEAAGAAEADVLYLHHLTPLNEAAARAAPGVPVIGHVHGSELLMLEAIRRGRSGHPDAGRWAERLRGWAGRCARIVVNSPGGLERAADLLGVDTARFQLEPNGVDEEFAPRKVDRAAHWRRHLVDEPHGWAPGEEPGSVRYSEIDLAALGGTVLLSVGRFTEVKRIPLLIEAFAEARPRLQRSAALVLLGGYPGEWEGEHPLDAVRRTGARDVFLAGWHPHSSLPDFFNASDVLVHPSVNEQFGQVVIEAMACGVPPIAVARGGPAHIVSDGETGRLIPPDDREALVDVMIEAAEHPEGWEEMSRAARREAADKYSWSGIGAQLAALARAVATAPP